MVAIAVSPVRERDGQRTNNRLGASWQWWKGGALGAIGAGYRRGGKDNLRERSWRRGTPPPRFWQKRPQAIENKDGEIEKEGKEA